MFAAKNTESWQPDCRGRGGFHGQRGPIGPEIFETVDTLLSRPQRTPLEGFERSSVHSSDGYRLAPLARCEPHIHGTRCLLYRQDGLVRDRRQPVLFCVLEIVAGADLGLG